MSRGETLFERTDALCERALEALAPGTVRQSVLAARTRLSEPLRVALAGRVSSGKSTLVNALLGRTIAATDQGECTQVVSRFHQGTSTQVVLALRGGERRVIGVGTSGRVDSLGIDPGQVLVADVYLDSPLLADMMLFDTPGLASATSGASDVTAKALQMMDDSTRTTVREADAVVYLFSQDVEKEFDRQALDAFQQTAMTAVGVLSRADTVGDGGPDAIEQARRQAERIRERMGGRVIDVVPVATRIAERVNCDDLDETELAALLELTRVPRDERLDWSRQWLLEPLFDADGTPVEVPVEVRARLHDDVLGMFGLLHSIDWLSQRGYGPGSDFDGQELEQHLRELSGIEQLRSVLDEQLLPRADTLKADGARRALELAAGRRFEQADPAGVAVLRELLETQDGPVSLELDQIVAARAALVSERLPEDLRQDALRLFSHTTPGARLGMDEDASPSDLAARAWERATRWSAIENDPLTERELVPIATTAKRTYTQIIEQLEPSGARR